MVSEPWMVPAARTAVAVFAVHSLQRISWNRCECSVGQESRLVNMKQRNLQNCSFLILCELCPCNLLNEIKRIKGNGIAKRSKHFAFSQWFLNCTVDFFGDIFPVLISMTVIIIIGTLFSTESFARLKSVEPGDRGDDGTCKISKGGVEKRPEGRRRNLGRCWEGRLPFQTF